MFFAKHSELEKVVLYGSRTNGNFKPESDIDLTLFGENLTLTIQQRIESELDDLLLPNKFDISIHNKISNQDLLEHIKRVGKLIYSK